MGWLGWTYDQTLNTPIWAIEMAFKSKIDMLRAIHGGAEENTDKPEGMVPATKNNVVAMFRAMKSKGNR